MLQVVEIIRPETLIRWHRTGFRSYRRWKSRNRGGRPRIDTDLRALIKQMTLENPLWGAPRVHGELLKRLRSISVHRREAHAETAWQTTGPELVDLFRNHAPEIAAMDLFVVPTLAFRLLYGFIIVRLDRRELVWIAVTRNPTADWIARQLTEAFPWDSAPAYLIRDRDRAFGPVVCQRMRAMGIRDKPIASRSPWQNGFAERLIGSIRRECLDHVIIGGEVHLRRVLETYARYYNRCARTGRSEKTLP
jgi:transposase InsO family protein